MDGADRRPRVRGGGFPVPRRGGRRGRRRTRADAGQGGRRRLSAGRHRGPVPRHAAGAGPGRRRHHAGRGHGPPADRPAGDRRGRPHPAGRSALPRHRRAGQGTRCRGRGLLARAADHRAPGRAGRIGPVAARHALRQRLPPAAPPRRRPCRVGERGRGAVCRQRRPLARCPERRARRARLRRPAGGIPDPRRPVGVGRRRRRGGRGGARLPRRQDDGDRHAQVSGRGPGDDLCDLLPPDRRLVAGRHRAGPDPGRDDPACAGPADRGRVADPCRFRRLSGAIDRGRDLRRAHRADLHPLAPVPRGRHPRRRPLSRRDGLGPRPAAAPLPGRDAAAHRGAGGNGSGLFGQCRTDPVDRGGHPLCAGPAGTGGHRHPRAGPPPGRRGAGPPPVPLGAGRDRRAAQRRGVGRAVTGPWPVGAGRRGPDRRQPARRDLARPAGPRAVLLLRGHPARPAGRLPRPGRGRRRRQPDRQRPHAAWGDHADQRAPGQGGRRRPLGAERRPRRDLFRRAS